MDYYLSENKEFDNELPENSKQVKSYSYAYEGIEVDLRLRRKLF